MTLAKEIGLRVEQRPVLESELDSFDEAGACGTAAAISPVSRIDDIDNDKSYVFSEDGTPGPICTELYHKLRAIQYGDEEDKYGWITFID